MGYFLFEANIKGKLTKTLDFMTLALVKKDLAVHVHSRKRNNVFTWFLCVSTPE